MFPLCVAARRMPGSSLSLGVLGQKMGLNMTIYVCVKRKLWVSMFKRNRVCHWGLWYDKTLVLWLMIGPRPVTNDPGIVGKMSMGWQSYVTNVYDFAPPCHVCLWCGTTMSRMSMVWQCYVTDV